MISVGSWVEAFRLCRETDEKDTPYIALALELGAKVWTKDEKPVVGVKSKGFNNFSDFDK